VSHGRSRWFGDEDAHALARAGVDYLHLLTNAPMVSRLRHFMKSRGSTRRING
jgi:hypothetical protein